MLSVNIAKFLRIRIFQKIYKRLLLNIFFEVDYQIITYVKLKKQQKKLHN